MGFKKRKGSRGVSETCDLNDVGARFERSGEAFRFLGVEIHQIESVAESADLAGGESNSSLGKPAELPAVAGKNEFKGWDLIGLADLDKLDSGLFVEAKKASQCFFKRHGLNPRFGNVLELKKEQGARELTS